MTVVFQLSTASEAQAIAKSAVAETNGPRHSPSQGPRSHVTGRWDLQSTMGDGQMRYMGLQFFLPLRVHCGFWQPWMNGGPRFNPGWGHEAFVSRDFSVCQNRSPLKLYINISKVMLSVFQIWIFRNTTHYPLYWYYAPKLVLFSLLHSRLQW